MLDWHDVLQMLAIVEVNGFQFLVLKLTVGVSGH
jgi:hypothetical protein